MINKKNNDFSDIKNSFKEIKYKCSKEPPITSMIKEIRYLQDFIDNLGVLTFGRDIIFIIKHKITILPTKIYNSVVKTLQSIIGCCEHGNIADAYTLLRKYRDDLFFYLYLIVISENSDFYIDKKTNTQEIYVEKWLKNELSNLKITEILKYVSYSSKAKEGIIKYNLKDSFDKIGKNLNNFVHSNGVDYYNQNYYLYPEGELKSLTERFVNDLKYITMSFLFILSIIKNICIMSTDYIDALDFGDKPVKGSQYWVATFVSDFINKNGKLLDDNCKEYLREITGMEI